MGRQSKGEKKDAPKQARGNPGIWHGERRDFLLSYLDRYLEHGRSRGNGFVAEVLDNYLERFPYHFADGPTNIPDDATDEQRAELDAELRRQARVTAEPQIRSFFKNKATKVNIVKKSPFRDFFKQALKGIIPSLTRREPEHKVWMRQPEYREAFVPEFKQRWEEANKPTTEELAFRVKIAKEVYERQDEEVKARVQQLVKEDYERQLARNAAIENDEVTPESAQLCRDNLSALVEPLIQELLRLCNLTVGSLILARPPTTAGESISIMSVDVGKTVPSEGGVKLPDFEKEIYANVFLRHFMRFAVFTDERSAELHRAEERRQKMAARALIEGEAGQNEEQCAGRQDDERRPPPQVDNAAAAAQPPTQPRQAGRRSRRRSKADIDLLELSDSETSESGSEPDLGLSSESDDAGMEDERPPTARAAKDARRREARERREALTIPVDEYGVPLHDVRGREFSKYLRERLSRMSVEKRDTLLLEIDRMSEYELERQERKSAVECKLRAQLLRDGLLHEGDPLWGEVVPRRIDEGPSPQTSEHLPLRGDAADAQPCDDRVHPEGQTSSDNDGAGDQESHGHGDARIEEPHAESRPSLPAQTNLGETGGSGPGPAARLVRDNPAGCGEDEAALASRVSTSEQRDEELPHLERAPLPSETVAAGAQAGNAHVPPMEEGQVGVGNQDEGGGGDDNAAAEARPATRRKGGGKGGKRRREAQTNVFAASREGWEEWFALGVDNLVLEDVAPKSEAEASWLKLTWTWYLIEKHENFKKDKRVPTGGQRPGDIGEWIKRARSTTYAPTPPEDQPPADFVEDWAASMWAWWSSINPKWRARNNNGRLADMKEGGSWAELYYAGPNGHLSVFKGVKWWFDLAGNSRGSMAWLELVKDVQWALDGVLRQLNASSEDNDRPAKRRKTK
ncbi:hypothetical protein EV714DRAFT_277958 [Schizophyllum commune]